MNAKIKKINAEYEKNAAKIADLQARQKELAKQRTELEKLDIVGMVRSMGMTCLLYTSRLVRLPQLLRQLHPLSAFLPQPDRQPGQLCEQHQYPAPGR